MSNGVYNGYGYLRYSNFDQYQGEFKNGKRDGYGILRGTIAYQGEFKNGKFNGYGILMNPDDDRYGIKTIGQFVDGKIEGDNITMYYPLGQIAVGDYHNGRWTNMGLAPNNSVPPPQIAQITPPNFLLMPPDIFRR